LNPLFEDRLTQSSPSLAELEFGALPRCRAGKTGTTAPEPPWMT